MCLLHCIGLHARLYAHPPFFFFFFFFFFFYSPFDYATTLSLSLSRGAARIKTEFSRILNLLIESFIQLLAETHLLLLLLLSAAADIIQFLFFFGSGSSRSG